MHPYLRELIYQVGRVDSNIIICFINIEEWFHKQEKVSFSFFPSLCLADLTSGNYQQNKQKLLLFFLWEVSDCP